jgi:uncharacterized membrane protein
VTYRAFRRAALLIVGLVAVAAAARFWLHDAFPYFADYTEGAYRRYWPNRVPLLVHILGGTAALFAGPFQLWSGPTGRLRRPHRWLGYVYVLGIAISATASFQLVFHTNADFGLALAVLAVAWWATILMALVAVRNRRIDAHREWMIRSYIITFSFVSYRFLVGLSMFTGLGASRHATVLWLSWVVPLMLFELVNQWHRVMPLKRRPARDPAVSAARPAETADPAWL